MKRRIAESGHPWKVRDRVTGIEMVLVLPGEFLMGSPDDEEGRFQDEGPQHRVRLTRAFYLGVTEVTQAQWARLRAPFDHAFPGRELPVNPSLHDIEGYFSHANEGLGQGVPPLRLPTEAEREYACRAGTTGPFSFAGPPDQDKLNYNDGVARSSRMIHGNMEVDWETLPSVKFRQSTAPAGSLPGNPWGLHEMHGSLWEWTADKYVADAYADRGVLSIDPFFAPGPEDMLTLRGGSWWDTARHCRSAARDAAAPQVRSARIGFRVARSL